MSSWSPRQPGARIIRRLLPAAGSCQSRRSPARSPPGLMPRTSRQSLRARSRRPTRSTAPTRKPSTPVPRSPSPLGSHQRLNASRVDVLERPRGQGVAFLAQLGQVDVDTLVLELHRRGLGVVEASDREPACVLRLGAPRARTSRKAQNVKPTWSKTPMGPRSTFPSAGGGTPG